VTLTEALYSFMSINLSLLFTEFTNNAADLPIIYIVLSDIIDLAVIIFKFYYNIKYKSIFFNIDNKIYFKLYKRYFILAEKSRKLSKQ